MKDKRPDGFVKKGGLNLRFQTVDRPPPPPPLKRPLPTSLKRVPRLPSSDNMKKLRALVASWVPDSELSGGCAEDAYATCLGSLEQLLDEIEGLTADEAQLDSPDFTAVEMRDLASRDYVRKRRE